MKNNKKKLIESLKKKGIKKKILDAIDTIHRESFFDPIFRDELYEDETLPIGFGEKSDDLYTLGKMLQILDLKKKNRVLEIGTGCGYSTALIASLASRVVTIEYHEELALSAKERLADAGFTNIKFYAGDGTDGSIDLGFFDAMVILGGCSGTPYSIINLLNDEGRAVFPMGPPFQQQVVLFRNRLTDGTTSQSKVEFHDFCQFKSIRGRYGWLRKDNFNPEYNSEIERGKLEEPDDQEKDPSSSL